MALMQINVDPDAITAYANESIDAGAFVKIVSDNDAVTSAGVSSYAADDIKVGVCDGATDYQTVIGIAAEDASSGEYLTVYTRGLFIVRAGEAITAGNAVQKAETTDAYEVENLDLATGEAQYKVGRALTGASDADKYLIILLNV